jgi:hypothetical protein
LSALDVQTLGVGMTAPTHAPQALLDPSLPATQVR